MEDFTRLDGLVIIQALKVRALRLIGEADREIKKNVDKAVPDDLDENLWEFD